ncbi:mechanosensitive ion channel family protein [Halorientalis halophila]|uniref:mechanosensitive ion channel family protein n=1 Tax=Halorientalis halophila TaxID=3108499 RepID=UPI00300A1EC2
MALPGALELLLTRLGRFVVPAAVFVVAAFAFYFPARYVSMAVARRVTALANVDQAVELPALKVLHATIGVLAILVGASVSGVARFLAATAAITAGLTIALGFAARDVLGNVVSGVFIVLDPTFDIGDWIRWGDQEGVIEDISFRTTRVHTFDNELVAVPNSELTTNPVVNPGAKEFLRLCVTFEVDVENDLAAVTDLLIAAARDHPDVLDRPAATVRLREITETSAFLDVRFWVRSPEKIDVVRIRSEFTRTAKERFSAAGHDWPAADLSGEVGIRQVDEGEGSGPVVPDTDRRDGDDQ